MARRTRYSEYKDRYANYQFELTDDGADWGRLPDGELPEEPIYDAMPGVKGLRNAPEGRGGRSRVGAHA